MCCKPSFRRMLAWRRLRASHPPAAAASTAGWSLRPPTGPSSTACPSATAAPRGTVPTAPREASLSVVCCPCSAPACCVMLPLCACMLWHAALRPGMLGHAVLCWYMTLQAVLPLTQLQCSCCLAHAATIHSLHAYCSQHTGQNSLLPEVPCTLQSIPCTLQSMGIPNKP